MSGIINPNHEDQYGGLHHKGFKIYRDENVPEHLGIFTQGSEMVRGVRTVEAVGTVDWRSGLVNLPRGAKPDSIFVSPKRYDLVKAELSKQNAADGLLSKSIDAAHKKMN